MIPTHKIEKGFLADLSKLLKKYKANLYSEISDDIMVFIPEKEGFSESCTIRLGSFVNG